MQWLICWIWTREKQVYQQLQKILLGSFVPVTFPQSCRRKNDGKSPSNLGQTKDEIHIQQITNYKYSHEKREGGDLTSITIQFITVIHTILNSITKPSDRYTVCFIFTLKLVFFTFCYTVHLCKHIFICSSEYYQSSNRSIIGATRIQQNQFNNLIIGIFY